jgi:hypothetical protein
MGFSCGLAELLLCIPFVYLGAPYAFLMKFSYLSKKKGYVGGKSYAILKWKSSKEYTFY